MTTHDRLKELLSSLEVQHPIDKREKTLHDISDLLPSVSTSSDLLLSSNLLPAIANVLEENFWKWKSSWPLWVNELMERAKQGVRTVQLYPADQAHVLLQAFRKYLVNGCWDIIRGFSVLGIFNVLKVALLNDDEVYNILKKKPENEYVLCFFYNVSNNEDWQFKISTDTHLVHTLLSLADENEEYVWNILIAIAKHPDSKELLPKGVLAKASKSKYLRCIDLCAQLCNESDLSSINLTDDWIVNITHLLRSIIVKGIAQMGDYTLSLLDVILPIANISCLDSQKESLGKEVIPYLMTVVTGQLPDRFTITPYLTRGRQEATRALWNFAYVQSNRGLIGAESGADKLNSTLVQTPDPIIAKNIEGILHMLTNPEPTFLPLTEPTSTTGHVMISYNWGNQPIVKRIAHSLQERGYKVWLDIEQMKGSTLDAMAEAIEQASLVLICMSQKYADSPNCRLEGEYSVNRRVDLIPLMMQPGYRPDGWLGITLGAKLWYDFTDEASWDEKMDNLVKAIGERGKESGTVVHSVPKTHVVANGVTHNKKKPLLDWTEQDIFAWMKKEGISQHEELFRKHKFTGRALSELKRLHSIQNPTFIFQFCQQFGFGIDSLGEILEFSAAINNL